MGFLTTLFGMPKVVETAVTTIGGLATTGAGMIDNAFYTDQEKAASLEKRMDVYLKLQMAWANDNSVSAIVRRIIATLTFSTFFFLVLSACVLWKIDKDWAMFILKVITELQIGYLVLMIATAIFGLYGYGKYVSKDNIPFSTAAIDGDKKEEK